MHPTSRRTKQSGSLLPQQPKQHDTIKEEGSSNHHARRKAHFIRFGIILLLLVLQGAVTYSSYVSCQEYVAYGSSGDEPWYIFPFHQQEEPQPEMEKVVVQPYSRPIPSDFEKKEQGKCSLFQREPEVMNWRGTVRRVEMGSPEGVESAYLLRQVEQWGRHLKDRCELERLCVKVGISFCYEIFGSGTVLRAAIHAQTSVRGKFHSY